MNVTSSEYECAKLTWWAPVGTPFHIAAAAFQYLVGLGTWNTGCRMAQLPKRPYSADQVSQIRALVVECRALVV